LVAPPEAGAIVIGERLNGEWVPGQAWDLRFAPRVSAVLREAAARNFGTEFDKDFLRGKMGWTDGRQQPVVIVSSQYPAVNRNGKTTKAVPSSK